MTVTEHGEIELNGYKYRTNGPVTGGFLDPFPEQQAIGPPDYSNRRDLSSWIITGPLYIGAEEMHEKTDQNRCWWTNCIVDSDGHIFPPRKATALTMPTRTAATWVSPINFLEDATGTSGQAWTGETNCYDGNTATAGTTSVGAGTTSNKLDLYVPTVSCDQIRYWWTGDAGDNVRIDVFYNGAWNSAVNAVGPAQGQYNTVSLGATYSVTALRFWVSSPAGATVSLFEISLHTTDTTVGTFKKFVNFNGSLYAIRGNTVLKLDSGRTAFTDVLSVAGPITDTISSLASKLYLYQGDTINYYHMSTTEALVQAETTAAYYAFQYDNKLFKVTSTGTALYSTDPASGASTWTAGGTITDIASQIEGFFIGRDAAGVTTAYCATHSVLKALDLATPKWVDTEVRLPDHPIGGRGRAYWNGKHYLSYGLGVKEYDPSGGTLADVGLTVRDGLPAEYNGEIVCLLGDTGVKGIFLAVDASITSGTSSSGLYFFDGGNRCWWADTNNDAAMHDIIVSSASSGYAVYWDAGGTVYYIDIPRGVDNPDKIAQSYATAGILLSPWFDAGNASALKLAKSLHSFAKGVTTTETVALKYRLNHTNTDRDTGWTTLDTLNTTGENGDNEELFGSGAGISVNAIQFRLDFATSGSTAKADIQSLILYYRKRTGSVKLRVWAVEVLIDDYAQTQAREKVANLNAAIISATDVLFSYHPNAAGDESHYVTVNCQALNETTGTDYKGSYKLTLIKG